MASTSGDSDSGNDKRPVKRGKGQGGQKARYATQISPVTVPQRTLYGETDGCGRAAVVHVLWKASVTSNEDASPFKDRVPFLVCMMMGTGSVERFFSFGKFTDMDQRYSMSDNAHCVAFMAHCNGDVEGRLD